MQSDARRRPGSVGAGVRRGRGGGGGGGVAVGVATGAAVGAVAKSAYDKRKTKQRKVVVNKHYYQSSGSRTKYKPTYRKRK